MENGKINANPAKLIKHRLESSGRVRWLTVEEEVALRRAIEADPECFKRLPDVVIAVNTGMRLSEQIGLDWSQIDLERRVIWITRAKHGKGRHVRLNTQAVEAFKELLARNDGEKRGRVFADITVTEAKRHKWFNKAVEKAGIEDFRWHDLRHTFASRLVMSGKPLRSVQELMGHKSIQMTCRYAHLAPAVEQEAVESMGAEWAAKVSAAEARMTASNAGGAA